MNRVSRGAVVLVAGWWVAAACFNPTEKSAALSVQMAQLPDLFLKDSVQLEAQLVGPAGSAINNARIDYESSDPTVASVDDDGLLLAVGSGTATLTARARLYENTPPSVQTVTVRGLLEIDSIRPLQVRFGDIVTLYGVGLSPDSLILIDIGEALAPDLDQFALYVPADSQFPNRLGALTLWVPPPANPVSNVSVIGFNGVRVANESVRVFQFDIFEPNDTVPADLGPLPSGFLNPALSFESRNRDELDFNADWYRFENTGNQDRTLVVFGTGQTQNFTVFVTLGLAWNAGLKTFTIDPGAWSVGSGVYFCGGLQMTLAGQPFQPFEEQFPAAVISLGDLGAGTYNLLTVFDSPGNPQPYEIAVFNSFVSIDGEPADPAEENDWCDVAKNLTSFTGQGLSVDNPHDIDWFRFTVPAGGQLVQITASSSDSLVDVDLYLLADQRPTDLPIIDYSTEFLTSNDAICTKDVNGACIGPLALMAGDYFLVAVDYAGEVGPYRLGAMITAPPAPITAASAAPALEMTLRESFMRKRDATRGGPPRAVRSSRQP